MTWTWAFFYLSGIAVFAMLNGLLTPDDDEILDEKILAIWAVFWPLQVAAVLLVVPFYCAALLIRFVRSRRSPARDVSKSPNKG